jgi:hypothetical protein
LTSAVATPQEFFFQSRSMSGQLKKFKGINVADLINFKSKISKKRKKKKNTQHN